MSVRPACYLPEPGLADVARSFRLRRHLLTAVELAALSLFLLAVMVWAALGAGA